MSGGGYHSPEPTGNREALKAYAKAMFSGDNLPYKFEGEQPELSYELSELWAEMSGNALYAAEQPVEMPLRKNPK